MATPCPCAGSAGAVPASNTSSCSACPDTTCGSGTLAFDHQVAQTASELTSYRNSYATVLDENAVYHIDCNGNPVSVSRNPVREDGHNPTNGNYKNNLVFDFTNLKAYYYSYDGTFVSWDVN